MASALSACGAGDQSGVGRHAPTYTVSGTITGLTEGYLQMSNGLDERRVTFDANGRFVISALPAGAGYDVRIVNDTVSEFALQCDVLGGAAIMPAKAVDNVLVRCARVQSVRLLAGAVAPTLGRDGLGQDAQFVSPAGLARDGQGNVYVADRLNHTLRKISPLGQVTTLAGTGGVAGSTNGMGTEARFNEPSGIALDLRGNLLVTDTGNHTIRHITPEGEVTVLAGKPGESGTADGIGGNARFNEPIGIAIDPRTGDALVTDAGNHTLRRITASGVVTTEAGTPGRAGTPGSTTSSDRLAAQFNAPGALVADREGVIHVADTGNHVIRRIAEGKVTVLAGIPDKSGAPDQGLERQEKGAPCAKAHFNSPRGLLLDSDGTLLVADTGGHVIRRIRQTNGTCTVTLRVGEPDEPGAEDTVAGGEPPRFGTPVGLLLDLSGNLIVADESSGTIRRVTASNVVSTWAGKAEQYGHVDSADGKPLFNQPGGLALDEDGTLYVADTGNDAIRVIKPHGSLSSTGQANQASTTVSTLAGQPEALPGLVDGSGRAARFDRPSHLVWHKTWGLLVSDSGNHAIRRVTSDGNVITLAGAPDENGQGDYKDGPGAAARFDTPQGLALSPDGQILYVADSGNQVIRRIQLATGVVDTLAGVAGEYGSQDGGLDDNLISTARFYTPTGLAMDTQGRLLVTDTGNLSVRQVTADGQVSTVAGGDGSDDFTSADLIARDSAGNLFVVDGSTIRTLTRLASETTYQVQTLYGSPASDVRIQPASLGPMPRTLGQPAGLALTAKRVYFTSGDAVLFIDR